MTPRERGFLLLRSSLGDPERKPLTVAQYRTLAARVRMMDKPLSNRVLALEDLLALGYNRSFAEHILRLLSQEEQLDAYLGAGERHGCTPLPRIDPRYPTRIKESLGWEAPGCFWAKGDLDVLEYPGISLVGSRELLEENRRFAELIGHIAAIRGLTLISGNARGADRAAQDACLAAGGRVISILADELTNHKPQRNQLFLSEEDFNAPFSTLRALSRNRCIHALGEIVFVAQAELHKGGTWDGTVKNLRYGWSPVACFRDGSPSSLELEELGAQLVSMEEFHIQDL